MMCFESTSLIELPTHQVCFEILISSHALHRLDQPLREFQFQQQSFTHQEAS